MIGTNTLAYYNVVKVQTRLLDEGEKSQILTNTPAYYKIVLTYYV
jgi:hypothetical protein